MTGLTPLWLPILLAAVAAFFASFVFHMVVPWHRNDYPKMPREDDFRRLVGPLGVPPGEYMVPRSTSMDEMKAEAFKQKWREGPNMIVTVLPNEEMGMGGTLVKWFAYLLVVALFGAYVASRALPPGAEYLRVFQVVGATTFIALAAALWHIAIWYRRSWRITILDTFDSLVYALLMAGIFGWLWPAG